MSMCQNQLFTTRLVNQYWGKIWSNDSEIKRLSTKTECGITENCEGGNCVCQNPFNLGH